MIRKILFYISLVIGLALLFIFGKGNNINILAISSFDNNIGTLPIQMDINNYNRENLLFFNNTQGSNRGIEFVVNNGVITLSGTATNNFSLEFDINVNCDNTCILSAFNNISYNDLNNGYIQLRNKDTQQYSYYVDFTSINNYRILYYSGNYDKIRLFIANGYSVSNLVVKPMLVSNDIVPNNYSPYFKFGYILSGDIQLLCPSESVTQNISLLIFNNEDLLYKSNYFNGSSCGYIRFDNVYLPFNINNKGNVSFNLNLRFMVDGWGAGLYTLDYGSKLVLTPIYEAYYKGEFANDIIYTKLSYTSNNIYYNGYNLEYSDGSINLFYFLGNKNILGYNLSIEEAKFNKNVSSDYLININNYNKFSFNNFLNFPLEIYLFSGNEDTTLMTMTSTNIYISFSSISSRVNNNQSTTTPLPDNELTIDKYNTCSAWYDIPCQLGNALTYVIYEAPIISPILTFIVSFVSMFSSLVSFVDLFRSFGIVFGCFVIYMFIELLHKYSK